VKIYLGIYQEDAYWNRAFIVRANHENEIKERCAALGLNLLSVTECARGEVAANLWGCDVEWMDWNIEERN
jgi:hypothetical protein